jgi:hypothetical protein
LYQRQAASGAKEEKKSSGMGREGSLFQGELPNICHGVCEWSRCLSTFIVGPARKARESFFAEDFGDRGRAEVVLSGPLEFVADVVDRVVLLPKFDHP